MVKSLTLSLLIFSGFSMTSAEVWAEEELRAPHSKEEQRRRSDQKTRSKGSPCLEGVRHYIFQTAQRVAHSKTQQQQQQAITVNCQQQPATLPVKQQKPLRMPHSKQGWMQWMKQRNGSCQAC